MESVMLNLEKYSGSFPLSSTNSYNLIFQYYDNKDISTIQQLSKSNRCYIINQILNNFFNETSRSQKTDKTEILDKAIRLVLPRMIMKEIFDHFQITKKECHSLWGAPKFRHLSDVFNISDAYRILMDVKDGTHGTHPVAIELLWNRYPCNAIEVITPGSYDIRDELLMRESNRLTINNAQMIAKYISLMPSIKQAKLQAFDFSLAADNAIKVINNCKKPIKICLYSNTDKVNEKQLEVFVKIAYLGMILFALIQFPKCNSTYDYTITGFSTLLVGFVSLAILGFISNKIKMDQIRKIH